MSWKSISAHVTLFKFALCLSLDIHITSPESVVGGDKSGRNEKKKIGSVAQNAEPQRDCTRLTAFSFLNVALNVSRGTSSAVSTSYRRAETPVYVFRVLVLHYKFLRLCLGANLSDEPQLMSQEIRFCSSSERM